MTDRLVFNPIFNTLMLVHGGHFFLVKEAGDPGENKQPSVGKLTTIAVL